MKKLAAKAVGKELEKISVKFAVFIMVYRTKLSRKLVRKICVHRFMRKKDK